MQPDQVEAYVDAAAIALELSLAPEHRPGVLMYFQLAAGLAELVMAQPLRAEDETAPVFTPVAPGEVPLPDRKHLR
jgi:hypothetical protein